MEVWVDEKRPEVVSTTNVVLALAVHAVFFVGCLLFARMHFTPKETVIPIDLTIVVNENLDGVEDEPPPVDDPPPPEPDPPPTPKVETPPPAPDPPPAPEPDAVVKVVEKKQPEVKPPEVKPPEPKPPEKKPDPPPKETQAERLERIRNSAKLKEQPKPPEVKKPDPPKETQADRLRRMVDSATVKKVDIKVPDTQSGNGRTAPQTMSEKDIKKYFDQGYKPGATTQIAESTMQLCISRIVQAIDRRWAEVNPPIGAEGTVFIAARLNAQGRLVNCHIKNGGSSGDRTSDAAALTVVKTVGTVPGLDRDFIKKYMKEDLVIRYKVATK